MSLNWFLNSFDIVCFSRLNGNATEEEIVKIIDAATWDLEDMGEGHKKDLYISVIKKFAKDGVAYKDLNKKEKRVLDDVILSVFSADDMKDTLKFIPEGEEFHPSLIHAVIERADARNQRSFFEKLLLRSKNSLQILPLFIDGRRLDGSFLPHRWRAYLILDPSGLEILKNELESELEHDEPWAETYHKELVKENFLKTIQKIIRKNKYLYAHRS